MSQRGIKRPHAAVNAGSSSSSSSSSTFSQERLSKSLKTPIFDARHSIYIVNEKLAVGEKSFLESVIRTHGGKTVALADRAKVIVTALKGIHRLKNALPDDLDWSEKIFVNVAWIHDSIARGQQAPHDDYMLQFSPVRAGPQAKARRSSPVLESVTPSRQVARARASTAEPIEELSQEQLQERYIETSNTCQRYCPLVCINDDIVKELALIKVGRKLVDDASSSSLAYSKAIASIKGYPWRIEKGQNVSLLQNVGESTQNHIREFLETGSMTAAEDYRNSEKFNRLMRLTQIHGVGGHTARKLDHQLKQQKLDDQTITSLKAFDTNWLEDFATPIPRKEVEEIGELVAEYIERVQTGMEYTICGGYRRGKPFSNDIDIVITHKEEEKEKTVLEKLVALLEQDGILVRQIYKTTTWSKRPKGSRNFHASSMDPLDKCFAVFLPPRRGSMQQIHRRVDLIVAPYKYYVTAVVGWTGSTQFERDLRIWAKDHGLKFDSGGLTSQATSKEYFATNERSFFEMLGLPYIPPTYRNADQAPSYQL